MKLRSYYTSSLYLALICTFANSSVYSQEESEPEMSPEVIEQKIQELEKAREELDKARSELEKARLQTQRVRTIEVQNPYMIMQESSRVPVQNDYFDGGR